MPARLVVLGKKAADFVRSPDNEGKMMYRSAFLSRKSNDDFVAVVTFSLLGLALSLLAIESGLVNPEYMADLFVLF
jgi:hypothetical protein